MSQYARNQNVFLSGLAGTISASYCVEGFGLSHMFEVTPQMAAQRLKDHSAGLNLSTPGFNRVKVYRYRVICMGEILKWTI